MLCCLTKSGVTNWCSQLDMVPCLILQCYGHSSKLVLLFNIYSRFHQFLAPWRDITITTRVGDSKFKCECLDCKAELDKIPEIPHISNTQGYFFLGLLVSVLHIFASSLEKEKLSLLPASFPINS